jgi:hypothetical protein
VIPLKRETALVEARGQNAAAAPLFRKRPALASLRGTEPKQFGRG